MISDCEVFVKLLIVFNRLELLNRDKLEYLKINAEFKDMIKLHKERITNIKGTRYWELL